MVSEHEHIMLRPKAPLQVGFVSGFMPDAVSQVICRFISASRDPYVVTLGGLGMFTCLGGVGKFPTSTPSYGIVVFLMEVGTNCYFDFLETNMFEYWLTQVVLTSEVNVYIFEVTSVNSWLDSCKLGCWCVEGLF